MNDSIQQTFCSRDGPVTELAASSLATTTAAALAQFTGLIGRTSIGSVCVHRHHHSLSLPCCPAAASSHCEKKQRTNGKEPGTVLKFGIASILQPEFGNRTTTAERMGERESYTPSTAAGAATAQNKFDEGRAEQKRHSSLCFLGMMPLEEKHCVHSAEIAANVVFPSLIKQQQLSRVGPGDLCSSSLPPHHVTTAAPVPLPIQHHKKGSSIHDRNQQLEQLLPSWIFCTRYSDRPGSGARIRKPKKRGAPQQHNNNSNDSNNNNDEEKRPRTAFTAEQLDHLKSQFLSNRYLTEKRRQELAHELGLNESQIKIWFQNKRAKLKKSSAQRANQAQSAAAFQSLLNINGNNGFYFSNK